MELAGKQVVLLHRGMDFHTIARGGFHDALLLRLQIIGVYKIYICMFFYPLKQSAAILQMQAVPAHMWNLKSFRLGNLKNLSF